MRCLTSIATREVKKKFLAEDTCVVIFCYCVRGLLFYFYLLFFSFISVREVHFNVKSLLLQVEN